MRKLVFVFLAIVLALGSVIVVLPPEPALAQPSEVWVFDGYCDGCPNDGHTWGYDAFAIIQDGIDTATSPGTVHVASGNYTENIVLKDGVQVLGAGADVTTIDGGAAGSVVTAVSVGPDTVLDGFTITNGSADRGGGMFNDVSSPMVTNCIFSGNSANRGGGMNNYLSSPTVIDCIFSSNSANDWGGGMVNYPGSSPTVANCTFENNYATVNGGGMFSWYSSPTVTNCVFSGNSAAWGGGMNNLDSSPTVTNCIFSSNSATWGGGMFNGFISPTITNCTFHNNTATFGGGMYNRNCSPTVTNCILWGNGEEIYNESPSAPTVIFSDVQGGYSGVGNKDADPMFLDPAGGDYHLQAGSPCIDAGTNATAPTEDIEGNPRPIDGDGDGISDTDMGAYEYVPPVLVATVDFDPDTLNLKSGGKVGSFEISIQAYIDGRSQLIITGNTVQWHHLDWAAPGRLESANFPTIINGVEWYPEWPDVPDAENRWCNCNSSIYEDLDPALPKLDMEVELNIIQARHSLSIAEYPSVDNDYTLIVDFNDNPPGGAAWYECELVVTWQDYPEGAQKGPGNSLHRAS